MLLRYESRISITCRVDVNRAGRRDVENLEEADDAPVLGRIFRKADSLL